MNFSLRFINLNSFVNKANPLYLNLASPEQTSENPNHFSRSGWVSETGFNSGLAQIFKYIICDENSCYGKLTLTLVDDKYIIDNKVKLPKEMNEDKKAFIHDIATDFVIVINKNHGLIHARSQFKNIIFHTLNLLKCQNNENLG